MGLPRVKPTVSGDALLCPPAADPKPEQDSNCNSTGTTQVGSFILPSALHLRVRTTSVCFIYKNRRICSLERGVIRKGHFEKLSDESDDHGVFCVRLPVEEYLATYYERTHIQTAKTFPRSTDRNSQSFETMNLRENLFGQGPKAGRAQAGYGRPPQPPPRDDTPMAGGYDDRGGYAGPRGSYGAPAPPPRQAQPMPSRTAVGRGMASPGRRVQLRIAKVEDKTAANQYIFGNL